MVRLPFSIQMSISVKIIAEPVLGVAVGDSLVAVGRAAFADNGVAAGAHIAGLSVPGASDGALLRVHLKHTAVSRETHLGQRYVNTWLSETTTCLGLECQRKHLGRGLNMAGSMGCLAGG